MEVPDSRKASVFVVFVHGERIFCTFEGGKHDECKKPVVGVPGGKWEYALDGPQLDLRQVAIRETFEETSLAINPADLQMWVETQADNGVRVKVFLAVVSDAQADAMAKLRPPQQEYSVQHTAWLPLVDVLRGTYGMFRPHLRTAIYMMRCSGMLPKGPRALVTTGGITDAMKQLSMLNNAGRVMEIPSGSRPLYRKPKKHFVLQPPNIGELQAEQ